MNYTEDVIIKYKEEFKRRRSIRIGISVSILVILISVTILAFPTWELFGMPKLMWAPFLYLTMFGLIAGIAFIWRCPVCNGLLGDIINTKYCSKCGFKFYD